MKIEKNCGLQKSCPENSFSIFLSTGCFPNAKPKLCINGLNIIKPLQKSDARGLNIAVVQQNNFDIISVKNFDTYKYNKSNEISSWIKGISENDIIIAFTYDEASRKLKKETIDLLNDLGSGKIQNLQFRSQWYMITQKSNDGTTTQIYFFFFCKVFPYLNPPF